jgi:hypothetical protein
MAGESRCPVSKAGITLLKDVIEGMHTLVMERADTLPMGDPAVWIICRMVESAQRDVAEAFAETKRGRLTLAAGDGRGSSPKVAEGKRKSKRPRPKLVSV